YCRLFTIYRNMVAFNRVYVRAVISSGQPPRLRHEWPLDTRIFANATQFTHMVAPQLELKTADTRWAVRRDSNISSLRRPGGSRPDFPTSLIPVHANNARVRYRRPHVALLFAGGR